MDKRFDGPFRSEAHAVSADGAIVVGSAEGPLGEEAMIWDAEYGIRRIKSVLIDDFGIDVSNYHLTRAHGISADGSVIVGFGADQSGQFAWIASLVPPPCPGDITGDDRTDVTDFGVFAAFFGQSVEPWTNGDMDGSGVVDVFDFGIFAADFGCGTE